MNILAFETSCDETAVAIVKDGTTLISQSIATSMPLHEATGGIVPEVASRQQSLFMLPVLQEALGSQFTVHSSQSNAHEFQSSHHQPPVLSKVEGSTVNQTLSGVDSRQVDKLSSNNPLLPTPESRLPTVTAIAVTAGPGLIGSLLVGVETAKALAYAWNLPLIPVNHMLGHIYGAWLTYGQDMDKNWPKLALLVSGGHTELILMHSHDKFQKVGQTLDDAAGEAFDKAAKLLGLSYPGGPALSRAAEQGDPHSIKFTLPLNQKDNLNFSFSGLKTALNNYLKGINYSPNQTPTPSSQLLTSNIAASFQHTIVQSLVTKTRIAAEKHAVKEVILGGGVAANTLLRKQLADTLHPTPVRIPAMEFTTDNAGVIASAAYYHNHPVDPLTLQANPSLELTS